MLEPDAQMVGSVHEDFAVESMAGDIFQLGNISYRVLRRSSRASCAWRSAAGLPPTIPFWLARRLGAAMRCRWRSRACARRRRSSCSRAAGRDWQQWLIEAMASGRRSRHATGRLSGAHAAALGAMPTQATLVMERFFDESGGTQLVIHSPYGSRFNRAWGLALRKRFCRRFNFELQAAATEDAIVLSLSTSHSFPLEDVGHYLHSNSVAEVLTQALLDAPMFGVRWRWNATTALALPRMSGGKKVAGAAAAHARRGSGGGGVPGPDRVRREPRRRARDARPSAGGADPARLPARGDGSRPR
jgi:ATP-dependent Lhr-like helicase